MRDRLLALFRPRPRTAEAWLARLGRPSVTPRELAAFVAWLDEDPAHLDSYQTLKALVADTRSLKSAFTAELAAIPARAQRRRRARGWTWAPPALGAVAAAAAAVVLLPSLWTAMSDPLAGAQVISTAVGEIRDVTLSDGSRVTLDTDTRIRVKMSASARRLQLEAGQAYFAVAHDADRPFEVALADRAVVVTGTRFTTSLIQGRAHVALLDGSITLEPRGAEGGPARLAPGQAMRFTAGRPLQPQPRFDPTTAADWRARRRIYLDVPLSDVLADLSRYTTQNLVVADPAVARMRVTAVVPLEGPGSVVASIDRLLPVTLVAVSADRTEVRAQEVRTPVMRPE
ncbi:hypothetical protein BZG35_07330 [Brevundimonas sp. LM2]|uniref:FecR family protein n=1 Tax=Brevundimonas sp. LM2 TaxID=1938605 RepID=UPI0009839BB8|nr:FecR domain-containing protein [Brevundimonas sp. LM2]AQR61484.1 hypothetical protein BZG35_07330 [Brevundimonas sp. LM2]